MERPNKPSITSITSRGVSDIVVREHLEKSLASGKKLRIKFGIDPTGSTIHLGHAVAFRKLRQFQELGHKIVLIIGDFTAQIGDPSGRSETRKSLTEAEVKANLKTYLSQAGKIFDVKKAEVRYNSEWHKKKGLAAILELARAATIQQVLKREDFQKRIKEDTDISLLETLYPLLQGYDSVAVKADVEIGGTDQMFNLLMGRRVQRHFGMAEQDVLMVPLIEGTDGVKKMSKSYGNYIGVTESAAEMFGKVMAIPDSLIGKYAETLTDLTIESGSDPRGAKLLLAEAIIAEYHGERIANETRNEWVRVFSEGSAPKDIPTLPVSKKDLTSGTIITLMLAAGIESKSEARRLLSQKSVKIDDVVVIDPESPALMAQGKILKIGKHRFFKVR